MADLGIVSAYDLDTGAGTERVPGINLRRSGSGGSAELLGTSVAAGCVPVVHATDQTVGVVGAAAEDAAATGNPILCGGRYDATPRTLDDGDAGAIALNASGQVLVDLAASSGTIDTELPTAAALADGEAAATAVPSVGSRGMMFNGTTWDRVRGTVADGLLVNLGSNNDVSISGTPTVDTELPAAAALGDATANPTVPGVGAFGMVWNGATWDRQAGTTSGTYVHGPAAENAAVVGNPLLSGGRYDATPRTLGDGDVGAIALNASGQVLVDLASSSGTIDTELPAAAALADGEAAATAVPSVGSRCMVFNGTTWDRMRGTTSGTYVHGPAAEDAAVVGNPLLAGGRYDATPRTLDDGDAGAIALSSDGHVIVDIDSPANTTIHAGTSASLAAGASADIDTPEAASKKLRKVIVWATVAFKVRLYTVDNAVESANPVAVGGGQPYIPFVFDAPHKDYVTLGATAGLDAFRAEITNLDNLDAADVYATFYYED